MKCDSEALDIATCSAEEYLRMHGYWVESSVAQDDTIFSDDATSNLSNQIGNAVSTNADSGALGGDADYYSGFTPLSSQHPLLEDDEEGEEDDRGIHEDAYRTRSLRNTEVHSGICGVVACMATSSAEASPGTISDDSAVTILEEDTLGALEHIVGRGGDHGAIVYRIPLPPLLLALSPNLASYDTRRSLSASLSLSAARTTAAYKCYPKEISVDELSFVATASRCGENSAHCQSPHGPVITPQEAQYAASHLVLPDALVTRNQGKVGLLMPLYDCSLKEFLQNTGPVPSRPMSGGTGEASQDPSLGGALGRVCPGDADSQALAFRSIPSYQPVQSVAVIEAIAFQLLEAVAYLNHRLPHGDGFTGYTHNDLHLDNILLSFRGDVALCDFELVLSSPHTETSVGRRRLPPPSRRSPHGAFSETADIWAFGLVLVSLLTGVEPLFTQHILNDFTDVPQLSRWDTCEAVLDWTANIEAHVLTLLRAQDPTEKLLRVAQPLLRLCGKCLVNRCGAVPLRAVDLLDDPLFAPFRADFDLSSRLIHTWTEEMHS